MPRKPPPAAPAAEAPAVEVAESYAHPLQDPRVRQALWYDIDMDAIVEGLWDNTVVAAKKSLVPEGTWQADGLTEYSYNPELAKQLLAEAGWDGSYTIQAVYNTANLLDTITAIQGYWAMVGVNMEFQLLTDNLTVLLWSPSPDGVTSAVDWDICFAGTNALTLGEFYNRHHSTAANNSTVLWYDELDALIDAAKVAVTTEDQKAAYDAIQLYENANATAVLPAGGYSDCSTRSEGEAVMTNNKVKKTALDRKLDKIRAAEESGKLGTKLTNRTLRKLTSNKLAVIGVLLFVAICILCFGAPLFTKYDPMAFDLRAKMSAPSLEHILGTDQMGRDIWSRILYGGRISIIVGLGSALGAGLVGVTLGPVVVNITLSTAMFILQEASLSVLGYGVPMEIATWGNIINVITNGGTIRFDWLQYWWMWLPCAIMLILFVLSINFIGDGLRDASDPTQIG